MSITGIDHVQIAIPAGGEGAARRFYQQVLGFREVVKPSGLSPNGCWFESGPVKLHVGIDPDFSPAAKAHPALLVDDLDELRARMEAAGIEPRSDTPLPGYRRFFVNDPFGNRIELMEKT